MSNLTIKKVPKLRFSGFSDEWNINKVREVFTIKSGQGFKASEYSKADGVPLLQIENVKYGEISWQNHVDMPVEYLEKYPDLYLKEGDIVLALNRPVTNGQLKIARLRNTDSPSILYQRVGKLIIDKSATAEFVYYLCLIYVKAHVLRQSLGSDQPFISSTSLYKDRLCLPKIEEQKKIAGFLTVVDERIDVLVKYLELNKKYKKGVLQKIFSQKLRFRDVDGKNYPSWQEMKLGDCVASIRNGLSLDQNSHKKGIKVTRIETISTNKINIEKVGYVDTDLDVSSYRLRIGDILFSNINSPSQIGRTVYIDTDYDIFHGMNLLRIQFDKSTYSKYIFYVLSSYRYKQYFERICNKAVNQASINQTDLKKTDIKIPCNKEQQEIVDFITTIEEEIDLYERKLELAKTFKKALLQQMFV